MVIADQVKVKLLKNFSVAVNVNYINNPFEMQQVTFRDGEGRNFIFHILSWMNLYKIIS